ncbi:MAG: SUMF1/EgtB/PvdO family nonheme iron enzyme [Planctomycetaceae bacterium]
MNRSTTALSVAVVCLFLSACGGGDEPAEEAKDAPGIVQRGVAKPAPVADTPAAPVPRKPAAPAKKASEKSAKQDKNAIDPNADPRDVFIVEGNAFQFDDGGPGPQFEPTDEFTAILPEAADPTLFAVTIPSRGAVPANQPALPEGFSPIPSEGFAEGGLPRRIRCEKDQSIMALVPVGTSPMGKNDGPPESSPQLSVYLDNFYIDVNEVTLEQYEAFRKEIKEEKKRNTQEPLNASSPLDHPALGVPYSEAVFFANRLGKDLPNEAEWEKAARGEKGFEFVWGSGRPVWSRSRVVGQIDPVQSFRTDRSPFNVYDLAGNAQEWCSDFYSPTHYSELSAGGSVVRSWKGPRRTVNENVRVVRGGGPNWESWHRRGLLAKERDPQVGFRCVLRLDGKTAAPKAEAQKSETASPRSRPLPSSDSPATKKGTNQ